MNKVYETIAESISYEISHSSGDPIALSISQLARRFGISRNTASKAANLLRDEGILVYGQGQRPRLRAAPKTVTGKATSVEKFCGSLIRRIECGDLAIGQYLPKTDILARQAGISSATVIAGLRALRQRNFIHKSRRFWVVGARGAPFPDSPAQSAPVILILQNRAVGWRSLASSERTDRFCHAFSTEAEVLGVRLNSVFTGDPHTTPEHAIAGVDQVLDYASRLGSRYAGTLMVMRRQEASLHSWASALERLNRPAVWLDQNDEKPSPPVTSSLFYRCHFSELNAALAACELLTAYGHKLALYPLANELEHPWKRIRLGLLKNAAAETGLKIIESEIILDIARSRELTEGKEPWWWEAIIKGVFDALRSNPDVTAIIAPRDLEAYWYYAAFAKAGLQIPQDLSIISFDNRALLQTYPVSSIDFGFGYLGYAAFHTILGDIPLLQPRRHNDIPAKPRVMDRGSVGMPRTGPLRIAGV